MEISVVDSVTSNPLYQPQIIEFISRVTTEAKQGKHRSSDAEFEPDDLYRILALNGMGDIDPFWEHAEALAISTYDIESVIGIDLFAMDEVRLADESTGVDYRVSCLAKRRCMENAGFPVALRSVVVRFYVVVYPDDTMRLFDIYEPETTYTTSELLVLWRN